MPGTMNFKAKLIAASFSLCAATVAAALPASNSQTAGLEQAAKLEDRILSESPANRAESRTIRDVSGNATIVFRAVE